MRSLRSVTGALLLIAGTAAAASAQSFSIPSTAITLAEQSGSGGRPQTRGGLWFSAGLGVGSLGCEDCDERETSAMVDLAVGGTIGERLLIGGAITGWSKEEDGFTLTVTSVEGRVRFYPITEKGFYLTGGLGLGAIRAELEDFGDETETGLGLTIGVGWDFRVGSNVSITPFWHGTAVSIEEGDANFGSLGVAVTIH